MVWDETPATGLQKAPTWFQWTAKTENSCLQGMQVVECEGLHLFSLFFFFPGQTLQLAGPQFPDQGLNPSHGNQKVES